MRPPPRIPPLAFAAVLAAVLSGCFVPDPDPLHPKGYFTLEVENLLTIEAQVLIVADGVERYLLGHVQGRSGTRFSVPIEALGLRQLRLVLHPTVGRSGDVVSESFTVTYGGSRVEWEVWRGDSRLAVSD